MVKVGDKVRIKKLAETALESIPGWMVDPSGVEGEVTSIDGDDEYPVLVEFEKEDPEDTRVFPDFYTEDELEVLPSE